MYPIIHSDPDGRLGRTEDSTDVQDRNNRGCSSTRFVTISNMLRRYCKSPAHA